MARIIMLFFDFINETDVKISKSLFGGKILKLEKILGAGILENISASRYVEKNNGIVELILVDDKKIQKLNKKYRGKNKATDVISFAYLDIVDFKKEMGDLIIGDIFISVDTAKRQAKENGHSLKRELEILFVHGLLHCFGFDHKNVKQEKEMEGCAEKILG